MKLDLKFVEPYLKLTNPKRREHYEGYAEAYEEHLWHFNGTFPAKLLERRRPAEDQQILQYRKDSFQPMTKAPATKVYSSLQKIRKSPDWNVTRGDDIPRIATGEDIYNYMYHHFPIFESIEKWTFNYFLKTDITDAGAVVITFPRNLDIQDNEYLKPFSYIIECDDVYEFMPNEYIIWKSEEVSYYTDNGKEREGFVCYSMTKTNIQRYKQTSSDGSFVVDLDYDHNLNILTCFPVGSVIKDTEDNLLIYETRVSGMIPALNEAICVYSDIQAERVQHLKSIMYSYQAQECKTCGGSGFSMYEGVASKCPTCKGEGTFPLNPYEHVVIRPQNLGDNAPPTPPVGYIQKDTQVIVILQDTFKQLTYDGLSAINMEFLAERPINQAGIAKAMDVEETNNFVYSVGEDCVRAQELSTYHCALWRYSALGLSNEEFVKMLPTVNVPIHFDVVSDAVMLDEIARMSTAKVDATLIKASNIAYAKKKFSTSPEVADEVVSRMMLDPLSGMGEDQIMMGKQDGFISDVNLTIHYNINEFIDRAIEDNKNWIDFSKKQKKETMVKYANEYLNSKIVVPQVVE